MLARAEATAQVPAVVGRLGLPLRPRCTPRLAAAKRSPAVPNASRACTRCLQEAAGERVMVAASLAAIMLQLASAYVALSLSVRLPLSGAKGE